MPETITGDVALPPPPPRRFRCTKGHDWEENPTQWNNVVSISVFGVTVCRRCVEEFVAANMGVVEDIPAAPPADVPTFMQK